MKKSSGVLDPKILVRFGNVSLVAKKIVDGFIAGLHRSIHKGASIEFAEHRQYTAGDDPKYLDWKVYGRTDRLYVREFREETNLKAYILLDASNSMNYSSDTDTPTKFVYAKCLAICLSYIMMKQNDSTGLVVFDSEIKNLVKPSSTRQHFHFLIENIENIETGKDTDIGKTIHRIANLIKRRSLIILISDLFDDQGTVIKGLAHFKHRHHEIIVFHLLDKAEMEFPFEGFRDFIDMETNERIPVDAKAIRNAYKHIFGQFLSFYQRACSERNINYARALTSTPFDYFLYHFLQLRSRKS
ncbi:MAG: DUF58 domain-containing protein [Candidatus Omnitrophica bacterium]|nr:DUF58 domain-containing protein [Candidatus Omnitrophota bacterium]MCM8825169.1 DUF58 domain-containing protein [Candidatus Omnitrophota bacterium]